MESGLQIWMNYEQKLEQSSDRTIRHGLVISTENGFTDTGNEYNTRESILRNCDVHRINDVIHL